MKLLALTGVSLLLSVAGCNKDNGYSPLDGTWTVTSYENLSTGATELKTQQNSWNMDITVTFDETRNPKVISGTNTTNQIQGDFRYTSHQQFKVTNLMTTEVNQPQWANEFIKVLLDADNQFKVSKNNLVIYYSNKSKIVTLTRI